MATNTAIVTLAIGRKYVNVWRRVCEANWREYATIHGYEVICIDKPLDTSKRAADRSPAWQKCLILSQEFARKYDRIVWLDADILINVASAPPVASTVPEQAVGAVEMYSSTNQQMRDRMADYWGSQAIKNPNPRDYYTVYGFPDGFDAVVQTAILVLSPRYHREILEGVYYNYEEKGGAEWHYEMRPLSFELLKSGLVQWIDQRFNVNWGEMMFWHYPFLLNEGAHRALARRLGQHGRRFGLLSEDDVRRACARTVFLNSFFMHFGGWGIEDMERLRLPIASWRECTL